MTGDAAGVGRATVDLERFVTAQADAIDGALDELRAGQKRSHWMWFVFPQMRGLGRSDMARFYGIGSLAEARSYLAHPVLAPRLAQCTKAVLDQPSSVTLHGIFGSPDDMKFCSSMTLFSRAAAQDGNPYARALARFCAGREDPSTLALIAD